MTRRATLIVAPVSPIATKEPPYETPDQELNHPSSLQNHETNQNYHRYRHDLLLRCSFIYQCGDDPSWNNDRRNYP
jgi:hypothetical protein